MLFFNDYEGLTVLSGVPSAPSKAEAEISEVTYTNLESNTKPKESSKTRSNTRKSSTEKATLSLRNLSGSKKRLYPLNKYPTCDIVVDADLRQIYVEFGKDKFFKRGAKAEPIAIIAHLFDKEAEFLFETDNLYIYPTALSDDSFNIAAAFIRNATTPYCTLHGNPLTDRMFRVTALEKTDYVVSGLEINGKQCVYLKKVETGDYSKYPRLLDIAENDRDKVIKKGSLIVGKLSLKYVLNCYFYENDIGYEMWCTNVPEKLGYIIAPERTCNCNSNLIIETKVCEACSDETDRINNIAAKMTTLRKKANLALAKIEKIEETRRLTKKERQMKETVLTALELVEGDIAC